MAWAPPAARARVKGRGARYLTPFSGKTSEGRGYETSEGRGYETGEGRGCETSEGRGCETSDVHGCQRVRESEGNCLLVEERIVRPLALLVAHVSSGWLCSCEASRSQLIISQR